MTGAEQVQRTWGPLPVCAADVEAFARGVGHRGPEPHPMLIARALIPGSAQVLMAPEVGADLRRIVHAGISIAWADMPRSGRALTTLSTLRAIETKDTGTLIAIDVDIREDDRSIASSETRYFIRGERRRGEREAPVPLDGPGLVMLEVPTTADQSLLYAEGSGDRFPIHTDDAFARAVGLPGRILHGMCTLSLCFGAAVERGLGRQLPEVAQVACRFNSMLEPGQPITLRVLPEGQGARFEGYRPDGRLVISEASVGLRRPGSA